MPRILLDRYTPGQINQAFWYLNSEVFGTMRTLLDDSIPWSARKRCIEAIAILFEDLFAKVCTDHLSHLDRGPSPPTPVNPVNLACYTVADPVLPSVQYDGLCSP